MKDGAHFRRLRDSFMVTHQQFCNNALTALHRSRSQLNESILAASGAHSYNTTGNALCDYLSVVNSLIQLRSDCNILHLSTVGRCKIASREWALARGGIG